MESDIAMPSATEDSAQTHTNAQTEGNTSAERQQQAEFLREKISASIWVLSGTLLTAIFFLYLSYLPIHHTDIWGHISYGDWILQHHQLPLEDPYISLAGGIEMIDNAWLSQVIFSWVVQKTGPSGISDLYALLGLAIWISSITAFSLRARSWLIGFAAAAGAWGLVAFRLAIVRPELFGVLCFMLLLIQLALVDRHRNIENNPDPIFPWWAWGTIPLTFTCWTNLHGSYIIGFVVLGCAVMESVGLALLKQRSLRGMWTDRTLRADVAMLEVSLLAACVNPYGIDLLLQTALFPTHPNLKSVMEWFPLEMLSLEGIPMAISWVLAAFAIRHSRVRFAPRDVLLLLVMNVAVCLRVRMIAWYAPIYFFVLAPHFADALQRLRALQWPSMCSRFTDFMSRRTFPAGLMTGFICYLAFVFSPVSRHVMGGKTRPEDQLFSKQTPIGVSQYFEENPPTGMIYAPQWWGDWILWKSDYAVETFVSTNSIHVVPATVWNSYMTISRGRPGFDHLLSRYRINTMVVSKQLQPGLEKIMQERADWKSVYEDDISHIFERTSLTSTTPTPEKMLH